MTATNHALTGALIGLHIGRPLVAILLAFGSHFLLDVIPHYGSRMPNDIYVASRQFKILLAVDIALCISLVFVLTGLRPHNWWLAAICAFIATLPDAIYFRRFIDSTRGVTKPKVGVIQRLSMKIQWYELPPGAIVEAVWAIGTLVILAQAV